MRYFGFETVVFIIFMLCLDKLDSLTFVFIEFRAPDNFIFFGGLICEHLDVFSANQCSRISVELPFAKQF